MSSLFISSDNTIPTNTQNGETQHLTICSEPLSLFPILERRLPHSCFMYNQLKVCDVFKDDLQVYTLKQEDCPDDDDDASNLWIFFKFCREDWDPCISISSPIPSTEPVPLSVQHAFENSGILNWFDRFMFIAVERNITDFIVRLNIYKYGNIIKICPSYLYYMDPEEALKLEVNSTSPSVEVRRMEPAEGTEFIASNWKYRQEGTATFVRKSIEKHISTGVYVNGELVCGALMPGYGLISCLLTPPEHRRKGYASLAMKALYKELAANGFYPCLDAEISDRDAVAFHSSINKCIISKVDYISHKAI